MRIIVLLLLSVFSLLFAKTRCYDFDDYADYSNDLVKIKKYIEKNAEQKEHDNCILEGGPGSVFHIAASIFRPEECGNKSNPASDYMSGSTKGYLEITFACNKCEGKKLKDELNRIEAKCNDACMSSIAYCQKPILPYSSWGGHIENGEVCGESLPECQSEDSSSSQDDESSSSEKMSSSSEESSSSVEESSSSEREDVSSSSKEVKSSSSTCNEELEECGPDRDGVECYNGTPDMCVSSHDDAYWIRPALVGRIKIYREKPRCYNGSIKFWANIPSIYYRPISFECRNETCTSVHSFEGFWSCKEGTELIEGCAVTDENGDMSFSYSVVSKDLFSPWGLVDFSYESLPSYGHDVPIFSKEELFQAVFEKGVVADYGEDLRDIYPQFSISSFDDYVRACAYHLNIDIEESSSSVAAFYSSSSEVMSSEAVSSSSENVSCSSNEVSSSSEGISSSLNIELSSSAYGEWLSSSSEKEFSLAGSSSSSEIIDGIFIPGPDQTYAPDQIFRGGLQNMEDGKCYSLNPERGAQYGWINTNAQDTWWWIEVPCDGSLPIVEKTSAGCVMNKRGANAVYNPGDCFFGGLDNMISGKCYSLNPERGTQYGWINNDAQDSWWWVETPCEKESNRGLYKKAVHQVIADDGKDEQQETRVKSNLNYDALGRVMNRRNAFGEKRSVYSKNRIVR